jgi:putative transposase
VGPLDSPTTGGRGIVTELAAILEPTRLRHLGVRFLLRQTVLFRTLYVFFIIHHANRQVAHIHVTPCPIAAWTAQQIVECCAWDRGLPRFLIHDRDSTFGTSFGQGVRNLGRTPFRSPRANAIAEPG